VRAAVCSLVTIVSLAIGIPTRNRAELAIAAVQSVLRSRVLGVSVVLSDNSTDGAEQDRLKEFCDRHPDEVLHYVRPPEPLPMPDHWEWLWQTIKATTATSHVAYLTDRLVFAAGALAELMETVASHPDQLVTYHWDHVKDLSTPVELVQSQWTGRVLELDTRALLELSSRGAFGNYIPRLMNCIAPVALLDELDRRFGDVFGSVSPDFRFAYRSLAVRDTILYLDRSCVIEHGMTRSAGAGYLRGTMNRDAHHFAQQLSVPRFGATPEPAFETVANAIFQEYCSVRDEVGGDGFPPVHWRSYLGAHAVSVDRIVEPEWRARMEELLRQRGWTRRQRARHTLELALEIGAYFVRHPGALARSVKRQIWDRPPGTPAARLLPKVGLRPGIRDELRFDSAAEAIAHADAHPRPRTPYAWHVHQLQRSGAIVREVAKLPRSPLWN
jgi:hypothetical protein